MEAEDTSNHLLEEILFEVDTCNGNVEVYV